MSGMSEKDLLSALDVLNARLDLEFGAALEMRDFARKAWIRLGPYVPEYVCELWLAPDGHGRDRVLLRGGVFPNLDEARLSAWRGLLGHAGLPGASSGEELELKLSLLPDRDVQGMLRRIACPEWRRP